MQIKPLEVLASILERFAHELEEHHGKGRPAPDPECPPPPPCPPYKIPDQLDAPALATALQATLAGTPADGSALPAQSSAQPPPRVVWVDHGDEVLAHLDSLRTRVVSGKLLVSLDLETDQTGRTPLVVAFALGGANDPAGLVARHRALSRAATRCSPRAGGRPCAGGDRSRGCSPWRRITRRNATARPAASPLSRARCNFTPARS